MAFIKLREEKDAYQIAFAARLGTTESIASVTSCRIDHAVLDTWVDVTADFITVNPAIIESGKSVQFTLIAATGVKQPAGRYRVRCLVDTNAGRTLETDVDLLIDA